MAEENTLQGVIDRIRAEGQLSRNTGTNSVKVTNEILRSISINTEGMFTVMRDSLALQKEALDDQRDRDLLNPPPDPADPTPDSGPSPADDPGIAQETRNTLAIFGGLGIIGKGIALALGGALGVIKGQYDAVKAVAKTLTPTAWSEGLKGLSERINNRISALRTSIGTSITSVRTSVTTGLANVGEFLKINPESNLGKAISGFKNFFTPVTNMVSDAGQVLKGMTTTEKGPLSKVLNFLNLIKGYFGTLGASVSGIAGVVGKIFAPIAIIVTAFDTVKGAIDGYAEGGILGGLQGAIDGLFTSLITKPLDLLKSAVAWVLEKLGFDSSAEALNSFSFTDLWTQMTDKIFEGLSSAIGVVKDLFTFGEKDKTALGVLGKLTDLVYAPVNMAINFVRTLFGWNDDEQDEPFKLQDYISEMFGKGIEWAKDALAGVGETIKIKFNELADWVTGIPDRITMEAKIMYTNVKAKLKAGFLMFGEWFASIPDRIKLIALETIRSLPGGGLLIGEDDVAEARSTVENRGSDLQARLQAVEDERVARLAELEREATVNQQNNNTVVNNGGNSTTNTTNNYYNQTGTGSSLDPSDPRFAGAM